MTDVNSKPIDKIKYAYYACKLIYSIQDWLEEAPGRSVKIRHTTYNKSNLAGYPDYMQIRRPTKEFHNLRVLHPGEDGLVIAEFTTDFDSALYDVSVKSLTNSSCWHVGDYKGDLVFTYNVRQSIKNYSSVECLYLRFIDSFTGSIPKFVEELINQ